MNAEAQHQQDLASIQRNLDRYDSAQAMLDHIKTISDITGGRSGMFGVPFHRLVPAIKELT